MAVKEPYGFLFLQTSARGLPMRKILLPVALAFVGLAFAAPAVDAQTHVYQSGPYTLTVGPPSTYPHRYRPRQRPHYQRPVYRPNYVRPAPRRQYGGYPASPRYYQSQPRRHAHPYTYGGYQRAGHHSMRRASAASYGTQRVQMDTQRVKVGTMQVWRCRVAVSRTTGERIVLAGNC